MTNATGYKVYRGLTSGGENVYYTSATDTFTDTNATSTAGTPPAGNTAWIFVTGTGGSGTSVTINGGATLTTANFNNTTPAAGACSQNDLWQNSGANVSSELVLNLGNNCTTFDAKFSAGATPDAQIAACVASASSAGGGICNATTVAAPTFSSLLAVPAQVTLQLGNYAVTCLVLPCFSFDTGSVIAGERNNQSNSTGTHINFTVQQNNTHAIAAAPSGLSRDANGVITITFATPLSGAPATNQMVEVQGASTGANGTSFNGPKGTGIYTVCTTGTSTCAAPTTSAITVTGGFSGTVDTSGGGVVTFVNPLIVPATPGSTTNGRLQNFTLNRLRYTNTSLVRASNIVTVTPSSPLTYAPQVGQIIGIYGSVGTASFNGLFNVCGTGSGCSAPSATSFQYLQTAGNETASNAGFLVVSDGAAGIDFGGSYNNQVFNVTVGWPDIPLKLGGTSQGSYYNDFYHSEFVAGQAANIAFGRSANQNEFYSVKFGPQTAFNMVGAYLDSSCVNNSFYSPDTEGGGVGLTAYIGGRSNSFYSAYAEAVSSPPIVIDATASFITVMGGIGNTVQDNGGAWAYNQVWNPGGTTTLPASPPGANYPQFFQAQYLGVSGAQQMFGLGPLSSNATTAPVIPRAMASCSRTSNVVTCILTGATQPGIVSPLPRAPAIGQQLIIKNTTAAGATNFNGNFNVCDPASVAGCVTPSTATFSYAQTAGTDTATGGEVDLIDSMEAEKIYFAAHTAGSSATQVQSARNDSGSEYYLPGVNGGLGYLHAPSGAHRGRGGARAGRRQRRLFCLARARKPGERLGQRPEPAGGVA